MTHVPKDMWPKAFAEGKRIAEHVHALNREKKAYTNSTDDMPPTDRELSLGACVMIFWAYKLQQEAGAAARRITLERTVQYLEEQCTASPAMTRMVPHRLLKGLRPILKRQEGENFLRMWALVERFMQVAAKPEYWQQEEFKNDPSIAIRALVHDLTALAQQGESNGQEEGRNGEQGSSGEESPKGDSHQAEQAAGGSEERKGTEPDPGTNGPGEGIRGGGEGMETAPCAVQEPDQEPPSAG